jgi:RNA-dependent RNA polymerase
MSWGTCALHGTHAHIFSAPWQVQKTPDRQLEVLKGQVVIAKHPVMHPGDVRTFRAVSHRRLMHHKNVLVLPQLGDRPHANEMSGSDLDGDIYAVMWDERLLTPRNYEPMDYTSEEPVEVNEVGG